MAKQQLPCRKKRRKQERAAKKARVSAHFSRRKEVERSPGGGVRKEGGRPGGRGRSGIRGGRQGRTEGISEYRRRGGTGNAWGVGSRGRDRQGLVPTPLGRRAALQSANQREDRVISRLEKLLKMKRRKNKKKLPISFEADGLGYLLDLTDKDSNEWDLSGDEGGASNDGSNNDEPEEMETKVSRSVRAAERKTEAERKGEGEEGEGITVTTGGERSKKKRKKDKAEECKKSVDTDMEHGEVSHLNRKELTSKSALKNTRRRERKRASKRELTLLEGRRGILKTSRSGDDRTPGKRVTFKLDKPTMDSESESPADEDDAMDSESESPADEDDVGEDFDILDSDSEEEEGAEEEGEEEDESDSDGYMEDDEHIAADWGEEGEEEEEGECSERVEVIEKPPARYVPPHLREGTEGERRSKVLERLRKRVQGLVNRLSESNMKSISTELEQLYFENSRNDMNTTLTEVLLKSCVSPALLADRFAMEYAMLIAILHAHVGTEIGAHVVQTLAQKLDELMGSTPNYGRGKECNCVLLLLAHLYNFKVIHCLLIYDIIRRLVASFTERDVELLLLILKNTGMEIRRDDATSLKDIILQIQAKAAASPVTDSSRMRFMLDTISALRTNNARKIPNFDPSLLEHMKKLLRGLVRSAGPADAGQLKISLQDLLSADNQGRWWVVGSAWTGRETQTPEKVGGVALSGESWVLELARKQRMSTDVRKNVFSVLMTSEDYVDAFEKLLRLGLKDAQEREVIHVMVDCCLQEKTYNPYYAFVGQKFCEFKRSHQVTFQYALWDRLKDLNSLTDVNRNNLCQLCTHLISTRALSLAVLRVVEFAELDKTGVKFYKRLLRSLLCDHPEDTCRAVFVRLAPLPHLKSLRDQLVVFIKHFLTEKKGVRDTARTGTRGSGVSVSERIKVAEHAMRTESNLL